MKVMKRSTKFFHRLSFRWRSEPVGSACEPPVLPKISPEVPSVEFKTDDADSAEMLADVNPIIGVDHYPESFFADVQILNLQSVHYCGRVLSVKGSLS